METRDEEEDMQEQECSKPRMAKRPGEPSKQEWEEHQLTHVPFRDWCPHCVRGKAKAGTHEAKEKEKGRDEEVLALDYMYMTSGNGEPEDNGLRGMPILAMKDRSTGDIASHVVPTKGDHWFAIKMVRAEIGYLGHKRVTLKSDQESAMLTLKEAVKRESPEDVSLEESPVGESQSNGMVERAIQEIQGQVRTLRDAWESRYGCRMQEDNHAVPWMVRHAGNLLSRGLKGQDGKTPYCRIKGHECRREQAEFGECVHYLKPDSTGMHKADPRWDTGVWLGMRDRTGEYLIGTENGVIKVRTIRRKGMREQQWDPEVMSKMRGVPWEPVPGREGIEIRSRIELPKVEGDPPKVEEPRPKEYARRRPNITRDDVRDWGLTPGCPGCIAANRNGPPRGHTQACRDRMEGFMATKGDERVERFAKRLAEEVEEQVIKEAKRRGEELQEGPARDKEERRMEESRAKEEDTGEEGEKDRRRDTKRKAEEDIDPQSGGYRDEESLEALLQERIAPKRKAEDEGEREIKTKGVDQVWKEWQDRGVIKDRRERWKEGKRGEEVLDADRKTGLLRITGTWEEFRGFKGTIQELREAVRSQGATAEECMKRQHERGLYFLHKDTGIKREARKDSKWLVKEKEAGYVMEVKWSDETMRILGRDVKKETTWTTNSREIAEQLKGGLAEGRNATWKERVAKGLFRQMVRDGRNGVCVVEPTAAEEGSDEGWTREELGLEAWDDVSGKALDPGMVKEARKEEMEEFRKHEVYEKVPIEECKKATGKAPIPVRWIDINKGDTTTPEYRSRLVAKEIKRDNRDDLFAATPPLEALKILIGMAVTEGIGYEKGKEDQGMKLEFIDIKRAFFHAKAKREVFVELPKEDATPGMCGRLKKSMYGTRDAAHNWEECYREAHLSMGFQQGKASTCVYYHAKRNIRVVIHGDDFTALAKAMELDWYRAEIMKRMTAKVKGRIGPGMRDEKDMRVLNRLVEWTRGGIKYEADPRHAEIIWEGVGMKEESKGVVTPGTKVKDEEGDEEELGREEATRYRALAARANYLAQDRIDIQYATKELCREMAIPTVRAWKALKRLARYLKEAPRYVLEFKRQGRVRNLEVLVDTDHAGCTRTRRSTSGGIAKMGMHCVKSWSTTQAVIATSSGESEYYGMVKGASQGLGIKAIMGDLGMEVGMKLGTDSSAAKGIATRKGLGKVRHIEVCQLWIQEKVQEGKIILEKVRGIENPADVLTKHVGNEILTGHMRRLGIDRRRDRHRLAPAVASDI